MPSQLDQRDLDSKALTEAVNHPLAFEILTEAFAAKGADPKRTIADCIAIGFAEWVK
jgi:hypothetical protein